MSNLGFVLKPFGIQSLYVAEGDDAVKAAEFFDLLSKSYPDGIDRCFVPKSYVDQEISIIRDGGWFGNEPSEREWNWFTNNKDYDALTRMRMIYRRYLEPSPKRSVFGIWRARLKRAAEGHANHMRDVRERNPSIGL